VTVDHQYFHVVGPFGINNNTSIPGTEASPAYGWAKYKASETGTVALDGAFLQPQWRYVGLMY
jgi:hypothetical protein